MQIQYLEKRLAKLVALTIHAVTVLCYSVPASYNEVGHKPDRLLPIESFSWKASTYFRERSRVIESNY